MKLIQLLKSQRNLNRRLAAEERRQANEGYRRWRENAGPETYTTYEEGSWVANILVEFNIWNEVIVFTDSFRKWNKPYGEEVSDLEFVKIQNRVARYFDCWGGEVTFDDTVLPTNEDLKADLENAGIPYEELEGGVIHYFIDIEDEKKRRGGFFRR